GVLDLSSPAFGSVSMSVATLPKRLTVISVTAHPDGRLDLSQNILRVPGLDYAEEPGLPYPYPKIIRLIQLAQNLYTSEELNTKWGSDLIFELLLGKWTEPILGCIGYYAARRWEIKGVSSTMKQVTARNLLKFFPGLPDARYIAHLEGLGPVPD